MKMVRCMQVCCDDKANNNIQVKGAKVYRCNGSYKRTGQINGRPLWQHTEQPIQIFWSRAHQWWQISTYYFNRRDSELPHMTQWQSATQDYNPCPAVRIENVDPDWQKATPGEGEILLQNNLTVGMEEKTDDRTPGGIAGGIADNDNSDLTNSSVPTPTTTKVEIIDWNVANFPSIPGVTSSVSYGRAPRVGYGGPEGQTKTMESIIET